MVQRKISFQMILNMLGLDQCITKLQPSEFTTVGTYRNIEMANYSIFIDV